MCDESNRREQFFEFRIKSVLPSVSLMDDVSMRRADSKKKKKTTKEPKKRVVFCFSLEQ